MLVTTEAVILRAMKYRETSKILTLYTREFGKVSVLAKGARGPKSRFSAPLEPMTHVSAILYKKESRELHLLSRCDMQSRFRSLTDDLGKMAAAIGIIEVLNAVTHDEERSVPLFDLLVASLRGVDDATKNPENALYFFEAHLLELLGFRPDFSRCARCGGELPEEQSGKIGLNFAQGGVYCQNCSAHGFGLESFTPGAVNVLRRMLSLARPEAALRISLSGPMKSEVGTMLRRYLTTNVEGLRRLKSETVFASLLA